MFMDVKLNSNFIYDGEIGLLSPQKKETNVREKALQ